MRIFREKQSTEELPYYVTLKFVLDIYSRPWHLIVASLIGLGILGLGAWAIIVGYIPFSVAGILAIIIVAIGLFFIYLLAFKFFGVLGLSLISKAHIQQCKKYLLEHFDDDTTLEVIGKMAENDTKGIQVSSGLANLIFALTVTVLLAGNLLSLDYTLLLTVVAVVIIPLIFLRNTERECANVVILQAVTLCLGSKKPKKQNS